MRGLSARKLKIFQSYLIYYEPLFFFFFIPVDGTESLVRYQAACQKVINKTFLIKIVA